MGCGCRHAVLASVARDLEEAQRDKASELTRQQIQLLKGLEIIAGPPGDDLDEQLGRGAIAQKLTPRSPVTALLKRGFVEVIEQERGMRFGQVRITGAGRRALREMGE